VKPVRSAIIGTGVIAGRHAEATRRMGGRAELVAAVDVDRARCDEFCVAHDVPRAYSDVAEMLAVERPDLVHVCTPPSLHREHTIAGLEAGAWVLCEKPLVGSLADLDRIAAAEERTGRYCSVVCQWRFGSGARHLKRLIASGVLGRPLVGLCQTTWYRGEAYYRVPWRGRWSTEAGGTTMGHGIHATDLFLWLMGDWHTVQAMVGTLNREIEVEDVSMATVRLESGALASIVCSALSPRQQTYLRFDFQRATVEVSGLYGYTNQDWRYSIPDGATYQDELEAWRAIEGEEPSSHAAQLADFLDAMGRNERPPASGAEARRVLEFVAALYKSAQTGEAITRGSIGPGDPFYSGMSGRADPTPPSASPR
jgi:predicted dehydrogenase